jgi:hypothetical protein
LGKYGRELLPYYSGTKYEPTVLWDMNGDGTEVRKPDFDSLCETDLVIVFPKSRKIVADIRRLLDKSPAKAVYAEDENRLRDLLLLPDFRLRGLT